MIHKKYLSLMSSCIAIIASCIPFNVIIGSKAAWFSYSSMAIPALGYQSSLVYVILFIFTKSVFSFHSFVFCIAHRSPLLFATLALKKRNVVVSIVIPLFAMILFCTHPVGQQVFYYSWYWFIPMAIYLYAQDTLYTRALSASFIAHAVGSVVWLYAGHVPLLAWTALMPIVPCERLLIAAGIVGYVNLFELVSNIKTKKVIA